jgi:hypothetical protein
VQGKLKEKPKGDRRARVIKVTWIGADGKCTKCNSGA